MYVKGFAQILGRHGRAFDVPAGVADAPRAVPAQEVIGVGRFPQSKIGGIALFGQYFDARAFFLLFHLTAAQLAVIWVSRHIKIDRAIDLIGVSLGDERFDHFDLLGNVATGAGANVGAHHRKGVHVLEIDAGVHLHNLHGGDGILPRFALNFVLALVGIAHQMADIGDVLDIQHVVAQVAQVAHHHIEADVGFGVANVGVIVHGGTADVDVDFARVEGLKCFFFAG